MKKLCFYAAALLCLPAFLASAQLTNITAIHTSMGGVLIPSGKVNFTPVDANGKPISFSQGGGGLNGPTAFPCALNSGAIIGTCAIPDAALTLPANICYSVIVTRATPAASFTLPKVCGITGSSWSLDAYAPPAQTSSTQPLIVGYLGTANPPNPCSNATVYIQNVSGGVLWICVATVPVEVTGGGGGGGSSLTWLGPWSGSTGYLATDAVSFGGSSWIAIASSTNVTPGTDGTKWQLLAQAGAAGATGPTGAAGAPGAAGSTGATGPQGTTGSAGAAGQGYTNRGAWVTATAYSAFDVIVTAGSTYECLTSHTSGTFATDLAAGKWILWAQAGATGAAGPTGPTGPQGLSGGSTAWKGAWSSATAYVIDDAVSLNGSSYIATASNTNKSPDTNPSFWQLLAQVGAAGATGSTGATGPTGPTGSMGSTGAAGQGYTNRGAWVTATAYSAFDVIVTAGSTYECVTSHTSGTFATDLAAGKWILWAQAGATGAAGPTGSAGSAGAAATIAPGTVTLLSPGATPTVTNSGSSSAATFNFGLPEAVIPYVAGAGSVNVMTATFSPAIASLTTGLHVAVLPNLANTTTTPTLNVNGLGAKTVTKLGTAALVAGDYSTTAIAVFVYDGTRWQLQNPQTLAIAATQITSAQVAAARGGTAIDTSAATGIPQVAAGTWTVSTALPNGVTATTQSPSDNSTKLATTAYVDRVVPLTPISVISQNSITARAVNPITTIANSDLAQNHFAFTDGTDLWAAGANYVSSGTFIDDTGQAMLATPSYFTSAQVLNYVTKFIAAKDGSGNFPIALAANGTTAIFYSADDAHHAHVTGDGWIMVPQLLYLYYQKTGDLTPYTTNVAAIKTALGLIPRNGSTHLITVTAGDEYVPGFAFLEYMRFTGDVANASVWYARVCQVMGLMATAAGDSTNATFFNGEYSTVVASIKSTLIDGTTGLLKSATGQNSANLDIVSSSLATYFEMLTSAQETAISTYFSTNFVSLINAAGYILQSPTTWATVGTIPSGGGTPYGGTFGTGEYQGGYWSYHMPWFVYALGKTDLAHAASLLQTYRDGPDPTLEWYDRGTMTPNGAATTLNLVSATGPGLAATLIPSAMSVAAGIPVLNAFGVPVNSTITLGSTCTVTSSVTISIGGTSLQIPTCSSNVVLVESWPANDGSGSTFANPTDAGNPATATSVTWTTPTGFPGATATYNGTSSFAAATNSTNTNFDGSLPFSVSTWVYSTDDTNPDYRLVTTLDAAATNIPGWSLELVGSNGLGQNQVGFLLSSAIGSNLINVVSSTTLTLNAKHNVCVTYDGGKAASGVKIYIDGTRASATAAADSLSGSIVSPVPVYLGALKNGAGVNSFFSGAMRDTRIYTGVADCAAISAAGPI